MYLDHKFGLNLSLSEITLFFELSMYLDRTLAQRKAQWKAKSKVKVTQWLTPATEQIKWFSVFIKPPPNTVRREALRDDNVCLSVYNIKFTYIRHRAPLLAMMQQSLVRAGMAYCLDPRGNTLAHDTIQ